MHYGAVEFPGVLPSRRRRARYGADGDDRRPADAGVARAHPRPCSASEISGLRDARRGLLEALADGGPDHRPRRRSERRRGTVTVPFFGTRGAAADGAGVPRHRGRPADLSRAVAAHRVAGGLYPAALDRLSPTEGDTTAARRGPPTMAIAATPETLPSPTPRSNGGLPPSADLAGPGPAGAAGTGHGGRRPRGPHAAWQGRSPHPHARLRRHARGRPRSSSTSSATPSSTSSRSPTTSASTPRWPPGPSPRDRGLRVGSSSARRSPPSAATCWRLSSSSRSGRSASLRSTIAADPSAAASRSPPTPSSRIRCAPRAFPLRRLLADADPRSHPDAHRDVQPDDAGRPWHERVVRFAAEHELAEARQLRCPRARGDRRAAGRRFRAGTEDGAASRHPRAPPPTSTGLPSNGAQLGDLRAPAPQVRPRRARRRRRSDPPRRLRRDHGYPRRRDPAPAGASPEARPGR